MVLSCKKSFNSVDNYLSNMAARGLRPQAFNMSSNLFYVASISAADCDLKEEW